MQEFYINQNSLNPVLRMELVCDGRFDFKKSNLYKHSIQNANVFFSMKNIENNILKISNAKADIVLESNETCENKYLIQYKWEKRDVKEKGTFKGWFNIVFIGDLYEENVEHPTGNLIVPIEEELIIHIL
jgi:hypothetical protein